MGEAEEKKTEPTEENINAGETAEPVPAREPAEMEEILKKLEEAQKGAEAYKDQLLRKAAEFENYKRRMEGDFAILTRNANEALLLSFLPILDDLHRSLKQGRGLSGDDPFFKGIEMIAAKFSKLLEQQGLVPFDSVGKAFDVEYHDALLQMPSDAVPPHTVVEEVERGYKLHDRVLRHAKVVVSAPGGQTDETGGNGGKGDSHEAKNS